MGISMKEIGRIKKLMVMASICRKMVQGMRETGLMINKKATEQRYGQMVPNTKVCFSKVRNMAKEN